MACRAQPKERRGRFTGAGLAHQGHRAGQSEVIKLKHDHRVDILIVGAGVGLTAAWRLHKSGFNGSVVIVDLAPTAGGTSAQSLGPYGAFPLGAHYITFPNQEAGYMRQLLDEFGLITGYGDNLRPRSDPHSVCFAPESRVFAGGRFVSGLWPEQIAGSSDLSQRNAFDAICEDWRWKKGRDDRYAFSIPLAQSSRDPSF